MLLCPIIVGVAASNCRIQEDNLKSFFALCRYLAVALIILVISRTGILVTGILPWYSGFAAQVMSVALLCTIFAVSYTLGRKRDLVWWGLLSTLPFVLLTRTAIAVTALTLPLTFAPMKFVKRLIFMAVIIALGIGVFYTPRVQNMMFFSGRGSIWDLRFDDPDIQTSGRSYMWERIISEIRKRPWFGHGANASADVLSRLIHKVPGAQLHPHNDWLRLLYDYGCVGTFVFAGCLIAQTIHALRMAKYTEGESRILFYAGASSFLPLALFMITDNIVLYAAFWGNLQFTILGLAYAAEATTNTIRINSRFD